MLFDGNNSGQRRGLTNQIVEKTEQDAVRGMGLDDHAIAGVGDRTADAKSGSELKDEGSKPDALDNASDEDFDPTFLRIRFCGRICHR